jgi:hypothetical protein
VVALLLTSFPPEKLVSAEETTLKVLRDHAGGAFGLRDERVTGVSGSDVDG